MGYRDQDVLAALGDDDEALKAQSSGIPVDDTDNYDPKSALPIVVPQTVGAAPQGESDILKDYFLNQKMQRQQLNNAETTGTQNRFAARLGGAFNTIGQSMARQKPDNSAFDAMAKDADIPVSQVERQQKLDQSGDKLLLNYFVNKGKAETMNNFKQANLDARGQSLDVAKDRNRILEKGVDTRTDLGQKRLGLAEGNQALKVGDKYLTDKVMTQASTQLASIDKGLGRIAEIKSGKKPFTTTIKADLEKDLANTISGGTASSLGQLTRTEFHPYSAAIQQKIDKFMGLQGDINAPGYLQQLEDLFTGLQTDISAIKAKRTGEISSRTKNAVSGNKKAVQVIDDNAAASQPVKPRVLAKKFYDDVANKTKLVYSDGTSEVVDGRR